MRFKTLDGEPIPELDAVFDAFRARAQVAELLHQALRNARAAGYSYAQIAQAAPVTRQALQAMHSRLIVDSGGLCR